MLRIIATITITIMIIFNVIMLIVVIIIMIIILTIMIILHVDWALVRLCVLRPISLLTLSLLRLLDSNFPGNPLWT